MLLFPAYCGVTLFPLYQTDDCVRVRPTPQRLLLLPPACVGRRGRGRPFGEPRLPPLLSPCLPFTSLSLLKHHLATPAPALPCSPRLHSPLAFYLCPQSTLLLSSSVLTPKERRAGGVPKQMLLHCQKSLCFCFARSSMQANRLNCSLQGAAP